MELIEEAMNGNNDKWFLVEISCFFPFSLSSINESRKSLPQPFFFFLKRSLPQPYYLCKDKSKFRCEN